MVDLYRTMDVYSTDADRKQQFTELFSAHHTKVLAYARRRLPADGADDAVADAFLAAWRNLEHLSGDPLLWLYGMARGAVSNHRRGLDRIARLNERSMALGQRTEAPDHAESVGWRDPFIAAFDQLSEPEREVLRLIAWEGLSTTEGAIVLRCSVAAFKVRLHRARRHLRRFLDADGTSEMVRTDETRQPDLSPRPQSHRPRTGPLTCSTLIGQMMSIAKEIS
jgi:RNA polymerase sigma factor (sigma-70 family)